MSDNHFLLVFIGILISISGFIGYEARSYSRESYVNSCIENGGIPISLLTYTKGYGDSYACVEISRKIENASKNN